MRDGIHPEFRAVVFRDVTNNWEMLTKSTAKSKEKVKWKDGNEYPLITVEISSQSHPFYTGQQRLIDTEGRAEKFLKKYGKK